MVQGVNKGKRTAKTQFLKKNQVALQGGTGQAKLSKALFHASFRRILWECISWFHGGIPKWLQDGWGAHGLPRSPWSSRPSSSHPTTLPSFSFDDDTKGMEELDLGISLCPGWAPSTLKSGAFVSLHFTFQIFSNHSTNVLQVECTP